MMKLTWTATLLLVACSLAAHAQGKEIKDDLFVGTEVFAKNATSVTEINMDPNRLREVDGKDSSKAHSTVLSVVRTYSYDKPGMFRMEDVDVFRNKLSTGDWSCSVHIREMKSGSSTDVCSKKRSDDLYESAVITVSPTSLTFIHTIRKRGASGNSSGVIVHGDHVETFGGGDALVELPALRTLDDIRMQAALVKLSALDVPAMQQHIHEALRSLDSLSERQGVVRDLLRSQQ